MAARRFYGNLWRTWVLIDQGLSYKIAIPQSGESTSSALVPLSTTNDENTLAAMVAAAKMSARNTKTIDRRNGRSAFFLHIHHSFSVSTMTELGVGSEQSNAC